MNEVWCGSGIASAVYPETEPLELYTGNAALQGEGWESTAALHFTRGSQKGAMAGLRAGGLLPDEPLGENPFEKDDHRHEAWAFASGVAKERLALFYSAHLNKLPPEDAPSKEFLNWHLDCGVGIFDILAAVWSAMMPQTDQGSKAYEVAILNEIEKTLLAACNRTRPGHLSEQEFSFELQTRLSQRKLYWIGQMLKIVREAKERDSELRADKSKAAGLPRANKWEDIEFVIDDLQIEINIAGKSETRGYKEMGLQDRRSGNPSGLWELLRGLGGLEGRMPEVARHGAEYVALQKQIERLSKILRKSFGMIDDPIPHEEGMGYRARFKIRRADKFDS